MPNSPCRGCEKRNTGCHADCREYKKFEEECQEIRKERRKDSINRSLDFMPSYYK